jgi:hypothetical protein
MSTERVETEIILSGGDKAGKTINELTAQSVKLNREIKKMEIGSEEYVKATEDYKKINSRLREVKSEVYGVDKAQKILNSTMQQYVPFVGQVQKFIPMLKGVTAVTKGQTMAQRVLNTVTKAFPLAFIIGLLASLISYLTTTQEGMDKLRKFTLPVVQIFERMKGVLQDLGGSVFKGIAQMLKGDLAGGFKTLWSGIKDAGTGMVESFTEGIKAGGRLAELTVRIEEETNKLELSRARLNRQIDHELELSKDMRLSEEERNAAAQRAIDLINERTKQELALKDLQIEKMELEQEANDTSRADEFELAKLKAEREEIEAQAARQRRRLNNQANADAIKGEEKVTGAVKKEKDIQVKAHEDYAKMVERAESDLEALRISMIEDETERKITQYERDIAAFKGTEDQKAEYAKIKRQQLADELAAIDRKALQTDLKTMEEEEEIRRLQIQENFYNFLISEEERENQLYELKKSALLERLDLIREINGEESAEYRKQFTEIAKLDHEQHQKRLDEAKRFAEAKREVEQMQLMAFKDVVGSTLGLLQAEEDGRRKNIGAIKAFRMVMLKASFLNEMQSIWETANANPSNILFPGSGNIIAGMKTLAATIRFKTGIRQMQSLKYQDGGMVFGPSHAAGGIPFAVKGSPIKHEMEGGEIIMAKGVSQNPALMAAASLINQMGGGRSFAMGGPVNPMVQASQSPQQVINNVVNNTTTQQDSKELINELREFRRDINGWQRDLKVNVPIQKLREVDQRLADIEADVRI